MFVINCKDKNRLTKASLFLSFFSFCKKKRRENYHSSLVCKLLTFDYLFVNPKFSAIVLTTSLDTPCPT